MKNVLAGLLMMVFGAGGCSLIQLNSFENAKFVKEIRVLFGCGVISIQDYLNENTNTKWIKVYLNDHENPLLVSKITKNSADHWLDKNLDGRVDEHVNDFNLLKTKYPNACAMVEK